jgi:hypothetical protein
MFHVCVKRFNMMVLGKNFRELNGPMSLCVRYVRNLMQVYVKYNRKTSCL